MTYTTPKLPFAYNALEPYIDEATLKVHHDKHHVGYTTKLNKALENNIELFEKSTEELLKDLSAIPEIIRTAVINNGGGHVNHSLFWSILKKDIPVKGEVADAINEAFGSFENFKEKLSTAAATQFGSGWAWLVVNKGALEITSTSNQDTPLSEGKIPIITLDVWEHSYYLKYQNKRPEYIESFFNIINWEKVNELYKEALNK